MSELMIKIENVKKVYKLGQIGGTTLRDELQRLFAKLRKKDDPTKTIGAKNYNQGEKFCALDGVSFEVEKGQAIGLIGHNGAGKSTLLKLLSRVTAPTEGTISLNGRIASMLEVGTGFHQELTGRENVYMNGAILGMTKKEIDSKMEQIIDFSEVRQFIDTPVKRYSSGMYVKLAFSVAAHLDSEIVLMDEVLAVGDMNFQQKCIKKMRDIADSGRTIIYVSHNMNTIRQLCDKVIVLDKGKVAFEGDVEEGIAVYSKNSLFNNLLYTGDLLIRNVKLDMLCHFTSCELTSKSIQCGQKLPIKLTIHSSVDINQGLLRIVLFSQNGTPIGMSYTNLFKIQKGDNSFAIYFDTSMLSKGSYFFDIILSEYTDGIQIRHDLVNNVLHFNVEEGNPVYNAHWNNNWGNIMMPETTIM